ncbi:MAG TPA: hypothetical protein VMW34_13035, partial [Anaerolineales bacterium]|nr:hypothetical protein [Anaerolineales bacterium]
MPEIILSTTMPHILENSAIQLEINPLLARWSASSRYSNSPYLENIQLNLGYRRGRRYKNLLDHWPDYSIVASETSQSPHGPGRKIQLTINSSEDRIKSTVTFALPAHHPLLLWKISVENLRTEPIKIEEIELLSAGYIH